MVPVPVAIRDNGTETEVKACAPLDSGSTHLFCSRRVADQLGLQERMELTVTLNLLKKDLRESACVELMISGYLQDRMFL